MTCGIYEIKNKQDGRCYIGQSKNIERRWKSHLYLNPINTNENLRPTLELYHENESLVEFNIISQIIPEIYTPEELQFILSVHEKHELELRGGHKSDGVINERPISIPAVPPSILLNNKVPSFVDKEDVIIAISKWVYQKDNEALLNYSVDTSDMVNMNEKTQLKQEVSTLIQKVNRLEDEKAELEARVSFWKRRCEYWRNRDE